MDQQPALAFGQQGVENADEIFQIGQRRLPGQGQRRRAVRQVDFTTNAGGVKPVDFTVAAQGNVEQAGIGDWELQITDCGFRSPIRLLRPDASDHVRRGCGGEGRVTGRDRPGQRRGPACQPHAPAGQGDGGQRTPHNALVNSSAELEQGRDICYRRPIVLLNHFMQPGVGLF